MSFFIFLEAQRKVLPAMYSPHQYHMSLVCVLLFFLSATLCQDTSLQTIYSLDIFSSQKPCAQSCFWRNFLGCQIDGVASKIGCQYNYCNQNTDLVGAQNFCYCRTDLQPAAEAYITSCVKSACTVGDSSIDISSAGSIYEYYCSSKGFPINVPATTTQEGTQATTTVYVTVYRSSGVVTNELTYSTAGKI